jgi:membrane fusion protein (multidrug efflux system)
MTMQAAADATREETLPVDAPEKIKTPWFRSRRTFAVAALVLAAALGGGRYWAYASTHESTDDAQVDAEIVAVPAKLTATVKKIHFVDNQEVHAGDLLAELDDDAPRARLEQAQANLEAAEAAAEAADADARAAETNATGGKAIADASLTTAHVAASTAREQLAEANASIRSAQAAFDQAKLDRDRAADLYARQTIPKSQLDQFETSLAVAKANLDGARAHEATLRTNIAQATSRIDEASARATQASDVATLVAQARARAKSAHAQVTTAKAALDLAALDVSYTKILAPQDGVVSKKSITEGQNISAGQAIVQLVTPGVWITANFKETQVEHIRVGEHVSLSLDSYPSAKIEGRIESLSGATGSRFTLLPPDNASGNFTKVVQRVPVRIQVSNAPAAVVLRPGMSADVTVDTKS